MNILLLLSALLSALTGVNAGSVRSPVAAEQVAQQARVASERDARRAQAALDFLTAAFTAASPGEALSTTVSVRDLLDRARAMLDAQALDPAAAQSMQRLLAGLYDALG